MSILLLALAVQAAGQEVTTFHPLPSEKKAEQAKQQAPDKSAEAAPKGATPTKPEKIEVLSVREVPPNVNVRFVPPPAEEGPE